jgi:5-oxoprolinase (ATP-hydrolysing)
MMEKVWEFWVDRGGTFTDVIARHPDGRLTVKKYLSHNPHRTEDTVTYAINEILKRNGTNQDRVQLTLKMGTTVATNALLERKGKPTLLVITAGFADALQIGFQNRPDIFARHIVLPPPIYSAVIEATERVSAGGKIITPLDMKDLEAKLKRARSDGFDSCAIVFMHGYRYKEHEQAASKLAKEAGFSHVSCSHDVSPLIKLVSRGDSTVADAYLTPVLEKHLHEVKTNLRGTPRLLFMQSNGGLVDAQRFRGKDSLLSGPAGGLVGAVKVCERLSIDKLISFDMGGTSTDVSHYEGAFERRIDNVVAGTKITSPMMDIHTVAAGGGSVVDYRMGRLKVGPESAGAVPGPACYRNGGPLTITDCNVLTGKIHPNLFPKVFGEKGDQPLDTEVVVHLFNEMAERISNASGIQWTPEQLAERFIDIAVEKMASAIKKVSIERGHDVRDYALCAFGGAGGQHACKIADALGLRLVIVHPLAGVLSALGIGLSSLRSLRQHSMEAPLSSLKDDDIEKACQSLEVLCIWDLAAQGISQEKISLVRTLRIKYEGTDFALSLPWSTVNNLPMLYHTTHLKRWGFSDETKPLVLESISVEAIADKIPSPSFESSAIECSNDTVLASDTVALFSRGRTWHAPIYLRNRLMACTEIMGPALIVDDMTTTVVEPGWSASANKHQTLLLQKAGGAIKSDHESISTERPDPANLELFNNLFMSIAEEMGLQLQYTSHSVNIKERLDFSCALFDAKGDLIANAPHIPVHLGSMGESVRSLLIKKGDDLREGDSYAINNPFDGGTHLPDITVITPVFIAGRSDQPSFFVASRGHHADIGGITPGSMPPRSTTLEEEGVVIDHFLFVSNGVVHEQDLLDLLCDAKYPSRNPQQNLADLKAQVAANNKGIQALTKLCDTYGLDVVLAYTGFVRENAAQAVRECLNTLQSGQFETQLDDGSRIAVKVSVHPGIGAATVDFTGTSQQLTNNLNAPKSICRAATMYAFRTLIDQNIPLNDGCLDAIQLIVPPGSLLNPKYPAAVVAGNVETSQILTDSIFAAVGAMASSQGTMNNFTFGNDRYQYYETICGGSGASSFYDGTSAVHTHMTNSRLTDPEVLEQRFPVLVETFHIRKNSGGAGKHHGGNGVVRSIKFLVPMTASILSQRRVVPPFGLQGGMPGSAGKNYVKRANGSIEYLDGTATVELKAGDSFVIETPGGGGFGSSVS